MPRVIFSRETSSGYISTALLYVCGDIRREAFDVFFSSYTFIYDIGFAYGGLKVTGNVSGFWNHHVAISVSMFVPLSSQIVN